MNDTLNKYHQDKGQIEQEQRLIVDASKDSSKFALLYEKYFKQIFLFVLKRVESEDTAADITSQVFLKALLNLSKYRNMGFPFSSWLFRIARNELYDLYQQRKISMVLSIETNGLQQIISEIEDHGKEDYEELTRAIGFLEEDEVELIELRFFEKRAFKEIGEILEITENNAKVRTYRTLDKLEKLLKNGK